MSPRPLVPSSPQPGHLYDTFLHHYSRDRRQRRGVFFTPQPIAEFIVRQIDQLLIDDWGLPLGLADPPLRAPHSAFLLDPACGSGVFLVTLIDYLRGRLDSERWNAFVPDLLTRLVGIEILPTPALLAKLNIAVTLADTGYRFEQPATINILLGDALSPNFQLKIRNLQFARHTSFPIVFGNPPFSSLSTNTNAWIARLVRGDDEIRGYVRANGQRLNERKTWLHDDYVKFIRLAQWHVEEAGCGIVGFVTNHGYLDNATFRLMRQELLRVFPHIQIVDLHGNRKKGEVAPGGQADENVFGLDQGVAISLLSRPPTPTRRASEGAWHVLHGDLFGSRDSKLGALSEWQGVSPSLARRVSVLIPCTPDWRFVPASATAIHPEYDRSWSLADAMPLNATAPVTARDKFIVAFTPEELRQRIDQFRDLSIPDDEIRRRYFTRTRSARYESGDTRGWKLSQARRLVAADDNWQRHIVRCLYRPFDWRYVFWHPAMIDWPRTEVTRHVIGSDSSKFKVQSSMLGDSTLNFEPGTLNLCLIARRQQLPTQPCTFFWIADGLALDGVIRSDNKGSESLFPLYRKGKLDGSLGAICANFAGQFVSHAAEQLQLDWLPLGRGDLCTTFGPEDLFAYIYALFHGSNYRQRYAAELRADFPRIVLPPGNPLFAELVPLGRELIQLHVASDSQDLPLDPTSHSVLSTQYSVPARLPFDEMPTALRPLANFRVGGYTVLKKWLQPPHRSAADPEFRQIAAAIGRTLELMAQIDDAVAQSGEFLPGG